MDSHYIYVSENRGSISAYDKRDGTAIWKQELLNGMRLSPPLLQGTHLVVGDSQGYVNVIKSDNGATISRSASDDSPIVSRPVSLPTGFAVQTRKGGIFAFGL
jgi:outer membrane protein assembly factor BamB